MTLTRALPRRLVFSSVLAAGAGLALGAGTVAGLGLAYWGVRRAWRTVGGVPTDFAVYSRIADRP